MSKITRRQALGRAAAMMGGAAAGGTVVGGAGAVLSGCKDGPRTVTEAARSVQVLAETDVLVLGGGPAGMSAAIAAAREGVDTMIVERYGSFGGVITQQTMGSIAWYRFKDTIDAGGVRLEYEQVAKEMGATLDVFGEEGRDAVTPALYEQYLQFLDDAGLRDDGVPTYEILETELFKWVADQMLLSAGVTPLLHAWGVNVLMDGNTITGAVVESKSGRQAILAKRVIDCTGDADIAHFAGAPYRMQPNHRLMEATMQFGMSGVDLQDVLVYLFLQQAGLGDQFETGDDTSTLGNQVVTEPYRKAKEAGEIPEEDDVDYISYFGCFTALGELPDMNTIHLTNVNPLDVFDLTNAEIKGRERSMWAIDALKKYVPGFSQARLRTFAPVLGVRESRRIDGGYCITEGDVRNQAQFEDTIGICPEFLDGFGIMLLPTTGRYFQVPYRCMVPKRVENLLVAGRSVDGDRISHTATRQMACCCVTGQGAGVAAAVSIKDNRSCHDVSLSTVQNRLEAQNVRLR